MRMGVTGLGEITSSVLLCNVSVWALYCCSLFSCCIHSADMLTVEFQHIVWMPGKLGILYTLYASKYIRVYISCYSFYIICVQGLTSTCFLYMIWISEVQFYCYFWGTCKRGNFPISLSLKLWDEPVVRISIFKENVGKSPFCVLPWCEEQCNLKSNRQSSLVFKIAAALSTSRHEYDEDSILKDYTELLICWLRTWHTIKHLCSSLISVQEDEGCLENYINKTIYTKLRILTLLMSFKLLPSYPCQLSPLHTFSKSN